MRAEGFEHLGEADGFGHGVAQERGLAGAQGVFQTEFQRINAQFLGQLVQRALGGEGRLGSAEAAVLPGLGAVGVDRLRVRVHGLPVIRPAAGCHRVVGDVLAAGIVAARVGVDAHPDARQPAVRGRADLVADDVGVALGGGIERFGARIDQPHRPAHGLGHQRGGDERPRVLLAAERTARGRHDHAHPVERQRQRVGDVLLLVKRLVVAAGHGEPAFLVVVAQQRLALQRRVLQEGGAVFGFDDGGGIRERGVQVAVLHRKAGQHVVPAAGDVGRAGCERRVGLKDVRQDFVADLDCRQPGLQGCRRLRHHQRNRRAHHAHRRADGAQDRLLLAVVAQAVLARDVVGGEHSHDAWHAASPARCSARSAGRDGAASAARRRATCPA